MASSIGRCPQKPSQRIGLVAVSIAPWHVGEPGNSPSQLRRSVSDLNGLWTFADAAKSQTLPCICVANSALSVSLMAAHPCELTLVVIGHVQPSGTLFAQLRNELRRLYAVCRPERHCAASGMAWTPDIGTIVQKADWIRRRTCAILLWCSAIQIIDIYWNQA